MRKYIKSDFHKGLYRSVNCKLVLLMLFANFSMTSQVNCASDDVDHVPIQGLNGCGYGSGILLVPGASCQQNVGAGYNALNSDATGGQNTGIGAFSLYTNDGDENTGIGWKALYANTSGSHNTAVGYQALKSNSTADDNTALGYNALLTITTAQNNVGAGSYCDIVNGVNNQVVLGYNAFPSLTTGNIVTLGDANTKRLECEVHLTVTSDARFKFNVNEDGVKGLDFINRLKPVTYKLERRKYAEFISERMPENERRAYLQRTGVKVDTVVYTGFLAQEVEQACKLSGYNFDGLRIPKNSYEPYRLAYSQFVVPLVKAVKEQQRQIEDLKSQIGNAERAKSVGINDLVKNTTATMSSNRPNPFSSETTINYDIPSDFTNISIIISDLSGKIILSKPISSAGAGSITISAEGLYAGIYNYSLKANGQLYITKQMVVSNH